jgi:hypothetical protein
MTLEDFVNQWQELNNITMLVNSMSNSRENPNSFRGSYNEFRGSVGGPWNQHPFQEYAEFDEEAIGNILRHALHYRQGLEEYALNSSLRDLRSILNGVKERLGDKNLVNYVASLKLKADEPEDFVNKIRNYRRLTKPLDRKNPQPEVIKARLVEKIDRIVGRNPDEKTRIIADGFKGLYNIESVATSAYAHIFVRPIIDEIRQSINESEEWREYVITNLERFTREEKIEFFSQMYQGFGAD